jgi:hypothetical protein
MIPSTFETVSIRTLIPQEAGVGGYWPLGQGWAQGRKGPNWERRFRFRGEVVESSEAVVHVGWWPKMRGQHHHKLRFPQIGETHDSGECRMWEFVANLVSLSRILVRRHSLRTSSATVFSFSLLALSTMGTPLEDEYPTSFREIFYSFCIFLTPSLTSFILPIRL